MNSSSSKSEPVGFRVKGQSASGQGDHLGRSPNRVREKGCPPEKTPFLRKELLSLSPGDVAEGS